MIVAAFPKYDSYKPTGIEWVPEAPEHWEVVPITAAARVVSEANQPALELLSVYLGRGVIRFSDVDEKRTNATSTDLSKYQVVRPGNLVLNNQQAWRGSVGVSSYTGIVSPAYIVLDFTYGFDPRFADYYFQTPTTVAHFLISSKGVGTIQRNLYWPALRRCPITIPPLSEQRAIAAFLDDKCSKIDEAVRIKEEQIKLLRERRQILIQQAVTRGLNPDAPMKDSGIDWIGQIPAHWEVKKLKYASKIFRGKFTHRPRNDPRFYDGRYPFFQTGDVARAGMFLSDYKQTLNEAGLRVSTLIPKGTILITIAANIGDVAILDVDGCFPDSVVGFRPSEAIERDFLFYSMSAMKSIFMSSSIANAQANLNVDRIGSISITLPSLSEQRSINLHVERNNAKIDSAVAIKENQITALKEYKTTLINAAVTGKIKITEDML